MGCQTSSPPTMWDRKAGKVGKPFLFNIGLLCSKTFDDAIFEELFEAKYGLKQGRHGEDEHQGRVPDLDEGRLVPRDRPQGVPPAGRARAARRCPDFAAEHADIATGGIGEDNDWTLTHRAHRTRRGGHRPDDRRRRRSSPVPPRPTRRRCACCGCCRSRQPATLAGVRRPGPGGRRSAAEEEGRSGAAPAAT